MPSGGYDRYGNLLTINSTQCSNPVLSLTVNAYNQVSNSGFSYDAAGNLLSDGLYSYTWNAEGRPTTAAGVTYTYDGDGQRVKKSSGTLYWHSVSGSVLTETDLSGNLLYNDEYFGGGRMARVASTAAVYLYYGDHLGSSRSITDSSGNLCYDAAGNLTQDGTGTGSYSYTWDADGHDRPGVWRVAHTRLGEYAITVGGP